MEDPRPLRTRLDPRVPLEVAQRHWEMSDEEILVEARKVNETEEQALLVLAAMRGRTTDRRSFGPDDPRRPRR